MKNMNTLHKMPPPLEITQIRPGLFMSGYDATKNLENLNANSIRYILNLTG